MQLFPTFSKLKSLKSLLISLLSWDVSNSKNIISILWNVFDLRDLLVFGGLLSVSYGFYLIAPCFGWIGLGLLSMLLGLGWIIRRPK